MTREGEYRMGVDVGGTFTDLVLVAPGRTTMVFPEDGAGMLMLVCDAVSAEAGGDALGEEPRPPEHALVGNVAAAVHPRREAL